MSAMTFQSESAAINPLDIVERLVVANDWPFDRRSDQEISIQVPGAWCDISLYFSWNQEACAVHLSSAFDMRIPAQKRPAVYELIALVNEKLWLGHFGVWAEESVPMYRHALPLRGTLGLTHEQVEDLVETALLECERFYPAFQFVVWGGKTAEEAILASMVDTVGEA